MFTAVQLVSTALQRPISFRFGHLPGILAGMQGGGARFQIAELRSAIIVYYMSAFEIVSFSLTVADLSPHQSLKL